VTISKHDGLTISIKFSKPTFILTFSRRTNWLRKKYGRHDSASKFVTQSIDRLEAKISQLVNIYRNEEPLPYQYLTNVDISNPIDLAQESCFENQDSISLHNLDLTNTQPLTNWQVITSMRLNLNISVRPIPNFVI